MDKPTIEQIKAAMLKNRGGIENTSDAGLMEVWRMLTPETQAEYLASIKGEARSEK